MSGLSPSTSSGGPSSDDARSSETSLDRASADRVGGGPLRRASAAIDRLNDLIGAGIRWLVLAMVLVGAYNAIARYVGRSIDVTLTSNALLDLQWYFFSLIFLLGAGYALNQDVHVRVDVLHSRLGERGKAWVDVLGTALFLLPFCIVMLVVSYPAVRNSWATGEVSPDPGGLARYPIKSVILASFVLLMLQGLSQMVKKVGVLRGRAAGAVDDGSGSGGPGGGGGDGSGGGYTGIPA